MNEPEPPEPDLQTVAEGGADTWIQTFEHHKYGPLEFKAQLPRSDQLLRHRAAIDSYLADAGADSQPSQSTLILAASIAGLQTLMDLPVVEERREQDPDDDVHERVVKLYYDPASEPYEAFIIGVWMAFSAWRGQWIAQLDDLKNSSGEMRGGASNGSSTVPTGSPSTTPDSPAGPSLTTSASSPT